MLIFAKKYFFTPTYYICTANDNEIIMEQQVQVNTKKHWAFFFFWLIVISVMLYLPATRPFFWLVLPFVVTEFAKAMDIM
jgi:uncharacterized membrane-anchored protein